MSLGFYCATLNFIIFKHKPYLIHRSHYIHHSALCFNYYIYDFEICINSPIFSSYDYGIPLQKCEPIDLFIYSPDFGLVSFSFYCYAPRSPPKKSLLLWISLYMSSHEYVCISQDSLQYATVTNDL